MLRRATTIIPHRSFSVLAPLKTLPSASLAQENNVESHLNHDSKSTNVKTKEYKALTNDEKAYLERLVRVDQAGELGANYIYAGQYFVLAHKYPHLEPVLRHMWDQEIHHHNTFNNLQIKHNVRPSILTPLWKVGAFAMGAGTALISPQAAMACTEAVETVIGAHYNDQLRALNKNFETEPLRAALSSSTESIREKSQEIKDLIETVRTFRDEELEHLDTAIEYDSHEARPYMLLTETIKAVCRVAVFTAERV